MHILKVEILIFQVCSFTTPPPPLFFKKKKGESLYSFFEYFKLQFFREFQELWEFYLIFFIDLIYSLLKYF